MKKIIYLMTILSSTLLLQSCSKTTGCTDPSAKNFSTEADEDCKCCTYEGSVVFWYGKNASEAILDFGSTNLKYYLDDQLVGSSAADVFYTSAPTCEQNSIIKVTKDLGAAKSKAYQYKVLDQDNDIIWEGIVNIDANTCLKLELTE